MTKVVNLWGGPGAGKSTAAAGLFYHMKTSGLRVELCHEFAKDLTYDKSYDILQDQWYVTGEQARRMRRLVGQVEWIITDSPILMALAYARSPFDAPWFTQAVIGLNGTFDNVHVRINRVKPYQPYGRSQTESEAEALDRVIDNIHQVTCGGFWDAQVDGDQEAHWGIMAAINTEASK